MLHRALQIETLKSVHKNGVQYTSIVDKFKYFNTFRMFAVIEKNNGLQKFDFQTSVSF